MGLEALDLQDVLWLQADETDETSQTECQVISASNNNCSCNNAGRTRSLTIFDVQAKNALDGSQITDGGGTVPPIEYMLHSSQQSSAENGLKSCLTPGSGVISSTQWQQPQAGTVEYAECENESDAEDQSGGAEPSGFYVPCLPAEKMHHSFSARCRQPWVWVHPVISTENFCSHGEVLYQNGVNPLRYQPQLVSNKVF